MAKKKKCRNSAKFCKTREQCKKYEKRKMEKMVNRKNKGGEIYSSSYIDDL